MSISAYPFRTLCHSPDNLFNVSLASSLFFCLPITLSLSTTTVAGPRASEDPDIYEDTVRLLKAVCNLFFIDSKKSDSDNLKPLYPRTVEDAIDRLFSELPFKDKTYIAKLEEYELEILHPTLGKYIKEYYGLRFKNSELMKDCRFMAKDKDLHKNDAAALIVKELWKKLRKTHALRVVK